jgi:methoxymalonate biosynthesis acyl carrier protein
MSDLEMSDAEMSERLRSFIARFIGRGVAFADDQNLFSSGFVNSLFAMQLVLFVESTFAITVGREDMDIANFSSVKSLCAFVRAKQAACRATARA